MGFESGIVLERHYTTFAEGVSLTAFLWWLVSHAVRSGLGMHSLVTSSHIHALFCGLFKTLSFVPFICHISHSHSMELIWFQPSHILPHPCHLFKTLSFVVFISHSSPLIQQNSFGVESGVFNCSS